MDIQFYYVSPKLLGFPYISLLTLGAVVVGYAIAELLRARPTSVPGALSGPRRASLFFGNVLEVLSVQDNVLRAWIATYGAVFPIHYILNVRRNPVSCGSTISWTADMGAYTDFTCILDENNVSY